MTGFVLMAVLTLLALGLLTRPWWSKTQAQRLERRGSNIAAYRSRLAELDNEVVSGLLEAEAATALKDELGARLLADAEDPALAATVQASGRKLLPLMLVVLVPLLAVLAYFTGDSWRTQQTIDEVVAHPESAERLTIEAMVQRLERRLVKSPEDAEGWAMLGRSYFAMARYASAADAYHKANALNGGSVAEMLVGEGESLALAGDHNLQGGPAALFEQALKLDADQGKALWYGGLAAAQAKNFKLALERWLHLQQQELPPQFAEALEARLQELSQLSGLPIPQKTVAKTTAGVQLRIRLSVAAALKDQLPPGATLLVFAKAVEGPPMPLAAQKFTDFKLPMDVVLDDSMAMMPQLRLSQFSSWILTARISRSGDVKAQAGDLQGQLKVDQTMASNPVDLIITEQIKADPQ